MSQKKTLREILQKYLGCDTEYWPADGFEPDLLDWHRAALTQWQPIETVPKDGTWILLRGETGYIHRPYRVHVGHWNESYRPLAPWQTSEGCSFTDDGGEPTHWMPLPPIEEGEAT